jgi:hypothetical protein
MKPTQSRFGRLGGLVLATAMGLFGAMATGCTVHGRVSSGGVIYAEPPPPRTVYMAPRHGYVWVDGRWTWTGNRWAWVEGYWERERPGYVYVPGYWHRRGNGHVWVQPKWRASGRVRVHVR